MDGYNPNEWDQQGYTQMTPEQQQMLQYQQQQQAMHGNYDYDGSSHAGSGRGSFGHSEHGRGSYGGSDQGSHRMSDQGSHRMSGSRVNSYGGQAAPPSMDIDDDFPPSETANPGQQHSAVTIEDEEEDDYHEESKKSDKSFSDESESEQRGSRDKSPFGDEEEEEEEDENVSPETSGSMADEEDESEEPTNSRENSVADQEEEESEEQTEQEEEVVEELPEVQQEEKEVEMEEPEVAEPVRQSPKKCDALPKSPAPPVPAIRGGIFGSEEREEFEKKNDDGLVDEDTTREDFFLKRPAEIQQVEKIDVPKIRQAVIISDNEPVGAGMSGIKMLADTPDKTLTTNSPVLLDLWQMFKSERAGDCLLVCVDEDKTSVFWTHKVMLQHRCPNLLSKAKYSMNPLIMHDILRFIYTDTVVTEDQMKSWDLERCFDVLRASADLDIDRFRRVVVQHVIGRLSLPFNCLPEMVARALVAPRSSSIIYSCVKSVFDEKTFFGQKQQIDRFSVALANNPPAISLLWHAHVLETVDRPKILAQYDQTDFIPINGTITADFEKLFKMSVPSDVSLKSYGKSFDVHACMLSGRCPYFANLLPLGNATDCPSTKLNPNSTGTELATSNAKSNEKFPLNLNEEHFPNDASALSGVIEFIYTAKFPSLSLDGALNALKIFGDWKKGRDATGRLGLKDCKIGRDMLYNQVKSQWGHDQIIKILTVLDHVNAPEEEMEEACEFAFKHWLLFDADIVQTIPYRPMKIIMGKTLGGSSKGGTTPREKTFSTPGNNLPGMKLFRQVYGNFGGEFAFPPAPGMDAGSGPSTPKVPNGDANNGKVLTRKKSFVERLTSGFASQGAGTPKRSADEMDGVKEISNMTASAKKRRFGFW